MIACAMLSILYMWEEELRLALLPHSVSLERPLHCAAAACIYQADWEGLAVAVKVVQTGELDVEQVERECRVMLAVQHTAIVKVYQCFWIKDQWGKDYFVMVLELCKGDLVAEIKERSEHWPESDIWTMLISLVEVLAFMQEQGIAHRDLKPENIFLSDSGLKLGDFGNAKALPSSSLLSTLVGSPLYMSPLLREGLAKGVDLVQHNAYKSDVYSLGVTVIYMCRLTPAHGPLAEHLRAIQSTGYSESLVSIITWMTVEEEHKRCDFVQLRAYLHQPKQQSDIVKCMDCQCDWERGKLESPIQLMCNPSDHLFCSFSCYSHFTTLHSTCPTCHSPLQPVDLSLVERLKQQFHSAFYKLIHL